MKRLSDVRYQVAIVSFVFLFVFFKVFFGAVDTWLNPVQSYEYRKGAFSGKFGPRSKQVIEYKIVLDNGRSVSIFRSNHAERYRSKKVERLPIRYEVCVRVGIRKSNVYRPITEVALSECGE